MKFLRGKEEKEERKRRRREWVGREPDREAILKLRLEPRIQVCFRTIGSKIFQERERKRETSLHTQVNTRTEWGNVWLTLPATHQPMRDSVADPGLHVIAKYLPSRAVMATQG